MQTVIRENERNAKVIKDVEGALKEQKARNRDLEAQLKLVKQQKADLVLKKKEQFMQKLETLKSVNKRSASTQVEKNLFMSERQIDLMVELKK